jgi:hypothetical protein
MSEVTLNLIDSQTILCGQIHGSIADSAIAALSAEPETINELEAALARYFKPTDDTSRFLNFRPVSVVNTEPWDAGLVIIDLPARVVCAESTYSNPGRQGNVDYHDGHHATEFRIPYRLPDDWRFTHSLDDYRSIRTNRAMRRAANPAFDARPFLYGKPLIEFITTEVSSLKNGSLAKQMQRALGSAPVEIPDRPPTEQEQADYEFIRRHIAEIHSRWLMTPRTELGNATPREVLFAHQDFISFDLHTREVQWSLVGEGPPCLARDSFAYRFAGIGPHEWVVYYDLVRELIYTALRVDGDYSAKLLARAADWIEQPQAEYGGYVPAIILENERKRLPMAMHPRDMVIDEDCPMCQMMAADGEMGGGPGFWHLDGSHMDDEFVFSHFSTREEWEEHQREWEAFSADFERRWQERERIDHEAVDLDQAPF